MEPDSTNDYYDPIDEAYAEMVWLMRHAEAVLTELRHRSLGNEPTMKDGALCGSAHRIKVLACRANAILQRAIGDESLA